TASLLPSTPRNRRYPSRSGRSNSQLMQVRGRRQARPLPYDRHERCLMSSIYFQKTYQRSFGTFPLQGDAMREPVRTAIQIGFRAFDTAQSYGNEAELGEALADSGIPREELCITTKVKPDNFAESRFLASVEESL